jgi:hypothetical protein
MAASTYPVHGAQGGVKVGANQVATITSWQVDESTEIAKAKYCRATGVVKYSDGIVDAVVSIEALLDAGDTGQNALAVGDEVTLTLEPDNNGAGADIWTGTGTITNRRFGTSVDGFATVSATVEISGVLTKTTVGT